jgi:hypothetical protein
MGSWLSIIALTPDFSKGAERAVMIQQRQGYKGENYPTVPGPLAKNRHLTNRGEAGDIGAMA